jgi:hypothetical protein
MYSVILIDIAMRRTNMGLNQTSLIDQMCDPDRESNNEALGKKITLLAAHINAATYRFLKLIAEFDRCGGWNTGGVRSCAHWLNWKCGIDDNAARERVRIGRCLDELPLINEAFEKGEVSYSKVRAMTRVATDDNEEFLLMIAEHGTASHIEKLVRKYQLVERNQNRKPLVDEYDERMLTTYQDDSGMWEIRARLPQVEGGLVVKAIEEIVRQQNKPLPAPVCTHKNVSAETFVDEPELVETATFAQRRADAICGMAEHYIASASSDEDGGLKSLAGHERCQVVLHLDVETLKQAHNCSCEHHGPLNTPPHLDKQWISMENAKRLSCDASLLTVLEDKNGDVLNLSRNTRTVTPNLKRALDIRDETCQFPGCCESRYVDFHHIHHWMNGGETSKDNLVKLCRFHHRQLHMGNFSIEKLNVDGKQALTFKASTGQVMEQNPKLPICTVEHYFERQWPTINSQTGVTRWMGEGMDYSMAIDALVARQPDSVTLLI